jgi:hypothetical protein
MFDEQVKPVFDVENASRLRDRKLLCQKLKRWMHLVHRAQLVEVFPCRNFEADVLLRRLFCFHVNYVFLFDDVLAFGENRVLLLFVFVDYQVAH